MPVLHECRMRRPVSEYWLMVVVVGFHCDIISCELARRGLRRGATEASGSDVVYRVWAR